MEKIYWWSDSGFHRILYIKYKSNILSEMVYWENKGNDNRDVCKQYIYL
jgi:hypothetical protein